MTDPKVCFNCKDSTSKKKDKEEVTMKSQVKVLAGSETASLQETTIMEKVRAHNLIQVAGRSESNSAVPDKDSGKDVLVDKKKGVEVRPDDNVENTQPNEPSERENDNFATGLPVESPAAEATDEAAIALTPISRKIPFTSLSQVDADLALARALQEQERAYMLLRMGGEASDFDSSGSGSYELGEDLGEDDFEDDFLGGQGIRPSQNEYASYSDEEGSRVVDGTLYDDDEAFARALQDKEDRDTTTMLALAGIQVQGFQDWESADYESESETSQDMWQDVDPDNMTYEELVALGEAVGTHNKGLTLEAIAALPTSSFSPKKILSSGSTEQCVICRLEYEQGDDLLTLPCKHLYHTHCIGQWLQINKVCPVCNKEVSSVNGESKPGTTQSS